MKLAVFDLDYTIWQPEMYQIWGPPKLVPAPSSLSGDLLKETKTIKPGMILTDRNKDPMRVFDGASFALNEIRRLQESGHDIQAAVASRTDEPRWARICLDHLVINDNGTRLADCFPDHLIEISYGSKVHHLERLHQKTGIPFDQMSFFDNEHWNIQDVQQRLPVKCFYTPDGMTKEVWKEALAEFGMQ